MLNVFKTILLYTSVDSAGNATSYRSIEHNRINSQTADWFAHIILEARHDDGSGG